jgi:hypothetical protein
MQLKLHYTNNPLTATTTRSLAPELENFVRARATAAAGIHNTQSPDSRREDQAAACKGASEGKKEDSVPRGKYQAQGQKKYGKMA